MGRIELKCKPGKRVRHPNDGRKMNPGQVYGVEQNSSNFMHFWARRLKDGDVEIVEKKKTVSKKKSEKKAVKKEDGK